MIGRKRISLKFTKKIARAITGSATLALSIFGMVNAPFIRAQSPVGIASKFEVASVKPCSPNITRFGVGVPTPGRLTVDCLTAMSLIRQSYILFANGKLNPPGRLFPIEKGPTWIDSDRYTIVAKAEGTPNQGTMLGPMMQALLEERFKLKMHIESREVPVYELVVGKDGPKISASHAGNCVSPEIDRPLLPPAPGNLFFSHVKWAGSQTVGLTCAV